MGDPKAPPRKMLPQVGPSVPAAWLHPGRHFRVFEQVFTLGLLKFKATFFFPEERAYSFHQIINGGSEPPKFQNHWKRRIHGLTISRNALIIQESLNCPAGLPRRLLCGQLACDTACHVADLSVGQICLNSQLAGAG